MLQGQDEDGYRIHMSVSSVLPYSHSLRRREEGGRIRREEGRGMRTEEGGRRDERGGKMAADSLGEEGGAGGVGAIGDVREKGTWKEG
eukprot:3310203-Rhodomonas_salina.2